MNSNVNIERAGNGYILEFTSDLPGLGSHREVFTSLDEVFKRLLLYYERLKKEGGGDSYGTVTIVRVPPS